MDDREQRIYEEAAALWREMYGEAPPSRADGLSLLDLITANLAAPSYDRLRSPWLRPSTITWPRPAEDPDRRAG